MILERTNMGLVYVSIDARQLNDIRHFLAERALAVTWGARGSAPRAPRRI
jgi:hypothetical protein